MEVPGGSSYISRRKTRLGKRKRGDLYTSSKKRKVAARPRKAATVPRTYGLGKYTGEGPFPIKLLTTLMYRTTLRSITGSSANGTVFTKLALNDLYDFDFSGDSENKQPLFFDQLFSATGPYTRYEVQSWRTKITVFNRASEPMTVYFNGRGTVVSTGEEDSVAELVNRPFMSAVQLGPAGSGADRGLLSTWGKWSDHNKESQDNSAAYNASPSTQVIGTMFGNIVGSSNPTLTYQIDHYFDVLATRIDATVS